MKNALLWDVTTCNLVPKLRGNLVCSTLTVNSRNYNVRAGTCQTKRRLKPAHYLPSVRRLRRRKPELSLDLPPQEPELGQESLNPPLEIPPCHVTPHSLWCVKIAATVDGTTQFTGKQWKWRSADVWFRVRVYRTVESCVGYRRIGGTAVCCGMAVGRTRFVSTQYQSSWNCMIESESHPSWCHYPSGQQCMTTCQFVRE